MNKRIKNSGILFLVLFILLSSLSLFAGDVDRIGSAAGVQVQVPVGAKDLAMGGSNIVYTEGVDAIYWNPAGLSHMENSAAASFSTMNYLDDIRVNYLAVGANMGAYGHIGFSMKAFDFGDIPITTVLDMDGDGGQTFSPTFSTLGLTYANKLTTAIQVGVTAKMIYESIPNATATALAFDIGLQYRNLAGIDGVSFGVAVKNIGSDMQYAGSGLLTRLQDNETNRIEDVRRGAAVNQLPANVELGLAYDYQVMDKTNLIVTGVFASNNTEADVVKMGAEFNYENFLMVRAGYLMNTDQDAEDVLYNFTAGAGVNLDVGGTIIGIDYAFRNSQYFSANNMFSLNIGF